MPVDVQPIFERRSNHAPSHPSRRRIGRPAVVGGDGSGNGRFQPGHRVGSARGTGPDGGRLRQRPGTDPRLRARHPDGRPRRNSSGRAPSSAGRPSRTMRRRRSHPPSSIRSPILTSLARLQFAKPTGSASSRSTSMRSRGRTTTSRSGCSRPTRPASYPSECCAKKAALSPSPMGSIWSRFPSSTSPSSRSTATRPIPGTASCAAPWRRRNRQRAAVPSV